MAPLCQSTLPLLPPTPAPFPGTGQAHVLSPPPCRPAQRQPLLGGKGQQGHGRIKSWLAASPQGELCKQTTSQSIRGSPAKSVLKTSLVAQW